MKLLISKKKTKYLLNVLLMTSLDICIVITLLAKLNFKIVKCRPEYQLATNWQPSLVHCVAIPLEIWNYLENHLKIQFKNKKT